MEPGAQRRRENKKPYKFYPKAMDTILAAFKGRRLLDRFGFHLPKEEAKETFGMRVVEDGQEWVFSPRELDWLHKEHEAPLSGYTAQEALKSFLEGCIDQESV